MPKFFEAYPMGAGSFATIVEGCTKFGFSRTGEHFFPDLTKNVDGDVLCVGGGSSG
jgi:hypothetical protein